MTRQGTICGPEVFHLTLPSPWTPVNPSAWPFPPLGSAQMRCPQTFPAPQPVLCWYASRRGFERLLRKLLRLPSQPALLYLHVWQPDYMSEVFWRSAKMVMQELLAFYGVPSVSARNALYHLYMANASQFESSDWLCGWHPNPLGHRRALPLVMLLA